MLPSGNKNNNNTQGRTTEKLILFFFFFLGRKKNIYIYRFYGRAVNNFHMNRIVNGVVNEQLCKICHVPEKLACACRKQSGVSVESDFADRIIIFSFSLCKIAFFFFKQYQCVRWLANTQKVKISNVPRTRVFKIYDTNFHTNIKRPIVEIVCFKSGNHRVVKILRQWIWNINISL